MSQALHRQPPASLAPEDRGKLVGYAIVTDVPSLPIGSAGGDFIERISPRALDIAAVSGYAGVLALHNHDLDAPLGSVDTGTLTLSRDGVGLRFELPVNSVAPRSSSVYTLVRKGRGTGMSFGFRALADRWSLSTNGDPIRTVDAMRLAEISVLTTPKVPAYPQTVLAAIVPAAQRNARLALVEALALGRAA